MLPIFPVFLPEEPVYSTIARYSDMMRFGNAAAVSRAVFGDAHTLPVVDMPGRLAVLVSRLLPGHGYTVDGLIAGHTALPYYRAFLPTNRAGAVAQAMRTGTARDVAILLGHRRRPVAPAGELRFCRDCVAEDRAAPHGTPYRRRVHQLAGVLVCPAHGTVLTGSGVDRWGHRGAREYVSLSSVLVGGGGAQRAVDCAVPRAARATALTLATESQWLLQQGESAAAALATAPALWERFDEWFGMRGLVSGGRGGVRRPKVAHTALAGAARAAYSLDLLASLGVAGTPGRVANPAPSSSEPKAPRPAQTNQAARGGADLRLPEWVAALLRTRRQAAAEYAQHPLLYLLLLGLLDVRAARFFSGPPESGADAPDPEAPTLPAPCGNPACGAYDPPVPRPLPDDAGGLDARVVVACPACAFRYSQRRGETDPRRRLLLEPGPVWDARLLALVADPATRPARFVAELGLSLPWVQRQAYRLNVWHPTWTAKAYARAKAGNEVEERRAAARDAARERYRTRWRALRAAHPGEGRTALHARDRVTYFYLHRFDKAWLLDHLPDVVEGSARTREIDWAARGEEMLPRVRAAVAAIRSRAGRPARVTVAAVARGVGSRNTFADSLPHLPATRAFLDRVLEDNDAFAKRRILRAAVAAAAERRRLNLKSMRVLGALSSRLLHSNRSLVEKAVHVVNAHLERGVPLPSEWARVLASAPWEEDSPAA